MVRVALCLARGLEDAQTIRRPVAAQDLSRRPLVAQRCVFPPDHPVHPPFDVMAAREIVHVTACEKGGL